VTDPDTSEGPVTSLLRAWSDGDRSALDQLMPLVHHELKRLARRHLARERRDHTIQATALVNEAFVRLANERAMRWQDRAHFLAVASQLMRFILVDYARRRLYAKRGGGVETLTLDAALDVDDGRGPAILAIDDALSDLAKTDPRKARVVEMRLFGGLTVEESALVLEVSPETVMRDWRFARAWLQQALART
jgi:RNA polymerase sigma factor (TIGR02999 family)